MSCFVEAICKNNHVEKSTNYGTRSPKQYTALCPKREGGRNNAQQGGTFMKNSKEHVTNCKEFSVQYNRALAAFRHHLY